MWQGNVPPVFLLCIPDHGLLLPFSLVSRHISCISTGMNAEGLFSAGTYSAGTRVTGFTVSGMVTYAGSAATGFPGGGFGRMIR